MGTDEAKKLAKNKVEKITIPRVLSEMASVQKQKKILDSLELEIELIRNTEVLSYVQSKKTLDSPVRLHIISSSLHKKLHFHTKNAFFLLKMVILAEFYGFCELDG